VYRALTRCGVPFQNTSTRPQLCDSARGLVPSHSISHDPGPARPPGLTLDRFRLIPFRSPLLRESLLLSSPRGTEMFQFPRFPLPVLCVQTGVTPHDGCRVSPFGHPRIEAWSAAPRGFSQPKPVQCQAWWRCWAGVVGPDGRGTRPFTELQNRCLVEVTWNVTPQRVRAPYTKDTRPPFSVPE